MESILDKMISYVLLPGLVLGLALGCGGTSTTTSGPTISYFTPTSGGPGTLVTVTGAGFTGTSAVSVCGVTVNTGTSYPNNLIVSDSEITFNIPSTVTTTGPVAVTNTGGTTTTTELFDVVPTITSALSVVKGTVGTPVTIYGFGLLGVTSVTFGGVATTITAPTATQITVDVPTGVAVGPTTITLENGYGLTYATAAFTVIS